MKLFAVWLWSVTMANVVVMGSLMYAFPGHAPVWVPLAFTYALFNTAISAIAGWGVMEESVYPFRFLRRLIPRRKSNVEKLEASLVELESYENELRTQFRSVLEYGAEKGEEHPLRDSVQRYLLEAAHQKERIREEIHAEKLSEVGEGLRKVIGGSR